MATAGGFGSDPDRRLHREWVKFVLRELLEFTEEVIAEGQAIQQTLQHEVPEHDEDLRPDLVVVNPPGRPDAGKARLLVQIYPASQDLEHPVQGQTWKASPDTRMMELLHATERATGPGHQWRAVDAGRLLPATKRPASPLGMRLSGWKNRSPCGPSTACWAWNGSSVLQDSDTLEAMLAESALNQQEVTDQLGYQVRRGGRGAHPIARSGRPGSWPPASRQYRRNRTLRSGPDCHDAAGVPLLCRGTGPDAAGRSNSTPTTTPSPRSQAQLRETADQHGEEILERRHDAWCRLLSTFRAVYGGIEHDRLKLPAYGGRLFNPDRFPFLEGRKQGTTWKDTPADPLPVNNRTVLHLLEALQYLQVKVPGGGLRNHGG